MPVACGCVSSHPSVSMPWAAGPSDPCGEHSLVHAPRMRELWLVGAVGRSLVSRVWASW